MRSAKFWVIVCLLVASTVVLRVRGDVDKVPPSQPLDQMPRTIGNWTATDIPLDAETLQVLGKGFFLNRDYMPISASDSPVDAAPVGLFIGYFPTQRTGQSIHSPQHCLPGAGWVFDSSGVTSIDSPGEPPIQVGEYLISNGAEKQEVLYWYRSHGRSIASDYKAKLYTLADSIRYSRTDAALVRIVTPLRAGGREPRQRSPARGGLCNPVEPVITGIYSELVSI